MKTPLLFLFATGCTAPMAPAQKPAAAPMAEPMGMHEAQLASWAPSAPVFDGPAMAVAAARPERCSLRITPRGVMVDGDVLTVDDAIAICSTRSAVLVEVADDADQAIWTKLDAAFVAAKVPVLHRGHRGDSDLGAEGDSCRDNPLSKGCL